MPPQLPWTDEMVNVLLNLVVVKGVHIAAREEVKKKWNEVNDDLYLNPPFVGYKSVHYRKGDYRNLQEKYKRVKAAVVEDMHAGNKSKYTGELSQQYALIEQICQEIETQAELRNAKKEDAADLEKALRETEAKVLRKKEYGKRKNIDGTITDYTDGKRKAQGPGIDDVMSGIYESIKAKHSPANDEKMTEKTILTWINNNGKTSENLLSDSFISELDNFYYETLDLISSVGIQTIVSIYCSRGRGFDRELFQNSMRELGFKPLAYHKLYVGITNWHFKAEEEAKPTVTPLPMTELAGVDSSD